MRRVAAVSLFAFWAAAPALAQEKVKAEPAAETTPIVVNPKVLRTPSRSVIDNAYPREAIRDGVSGRTAVTCTVLPSTAVTDCVVSIEEPPGYGFGDASLDLVRDYRISPRTVDGVPQSDGKVNIPIRWSMEGLEPARATAALWAPGLFACATLFALLLSFARKGRRTLPKTGPRA